MASTGAFEAPGSGSSPGSPVFERAVFPVRIRAAWEAHPSGVRTSVRIVSSRLPFSEDDLRAAVDESECWADACRFLGYGIKGDNYRTLQRWAARREISTAHFDPRAGVRRSADTRRVPLEQVLVRHSTYMRGNLKRRLLVAGLKRPVCEMCGQSEVWRGQRMSMILDHINGVSDDHRLENLRMLCPNCNATLATHCGRNTPRERACVACGEMFAPESNLHRYCSMKCWGKIAAKKYEGIPRPQTRKVERPSYGRLIGDLSQMSMVKIGRKYGVSDNAVRKWLRWHEADLAKRIAVALVDGGPREIVA